MADDLCPRGVKLSATASLADHIFKTSLVRVLSNSKKNENQVQQLELLGAEQRDADEAFHRHKRFCTVCAGARQVAADYTVLR